MRAEFRLPSPLPPSLAAAMEALAPRWAALDIPAGTAVRFEPGIEMTVTLVPLGGTREVYGISLDAPGKLDATGPDTPEEI